MSRSPAITRLVDDRQLAQAAPDRYIFVDPSVTNRQPSRNPFADQAPAHLSSSEAMLARTDGAEICAHQRADFMPPSVGIASRHTFTGSEIATLYTVPRGPDLVVGRLYGREIRTPLDFGVHVHACLLDPVATIRAVCPVWRVSELWRGLIIPSGWSIGGWGDVNYTLSVFGWGILA